MKEKNNVNVLEVEVMEELPLEKKIENALVKENVTDKVINSLVEKYGSLRLKSVEDKESYLEIISAKREVRKVGIITEKICKLGREDANKIQKLWIEKEKEILAKIDKVQSPLEAEIKRFDDEVERKENEEKERKEAAYQQRQATLIKYGSTYNNGSFELNHISYEIDNIRECDEEVWNDIVLPKYKAEFVKGEAEKVRIEKEREEAALKLKQEQDDLKKQQDEIREQREAFQKEKDALQKMKYDAEKVRLDKEESDNRKAKEEKDKQDLLKINERISKLAGWGFNGFTVSNHGKIYGSKEEFLNLTTKEFESIAADNEMYESTLSKIAEKKRLDDIEAALQKERDRVAEQKRQDDIKAEQEKQRKIEELAKSGDKANWAVLIEAFEAINLPEMKSGQYRNKIAIVREKMEEIYSL